MFINDLFILSLNELIICIGCLYNFISIDLVFDPDYSIYIGKPSVVRDIWPIEGWDIRNYECIRLCTHHTYTYMSLVRMHVLYPGTYVCTYIFLHIPSTYETYKYSGNIPDQLTRVLRVTCSATRHSIDRRHPLFGHPPTHSHYTAALRAMGWSLADLHSTP